jgi:DNA repair exonuclease SbcCD nuclease subunit
MAPLLRVADAGVPVFLVPGNHERSRIPFPLLTHHPNVHLFDRPRTYAGTWGGLRLALAGFPFARTVDGDAFPRLVAATDWRTPPADVRLLCVHQAVEGATVGAHDFVFRRGPDVVPGWAIPRGFAAVLAGHIHRAQILERDLAGRPLQAPVVYPGSVERTSFVERDETKGCYLLRVRGGPDGGRIEERSFRPLATRPMVQLELDVEGRTPTHVERELRRRLHACDPDAVARIVTQGTPALPLDGVLAAARLRALAPPTLNVSVAWERTPSRPREVRRVAR